MKIPRNNKALAEIFKNAKIPNPTELNGEYFVDMLTVMPSLRRFSHRKVFYIKNSKIVGYNLLFTNKIWGHFVLEEIQIDSSKMVLINYNVPQNSFITNRIRDEIRCIEKDTLYLGRFNYLFRNRLLFLGYFTLSRSNDIGDRFKIKIN